MPSLIAVDPKTVSFEPGLCAQMGQDPSPHRLKLRNPVWTSLSIARPESEGHDECRLASDVLLGDLPCAVGSRVTLKNMYRADACGLSWSLARVSVEGHQPVETFAALNRDGDLLPPADEELTLTPVKAQDRGLVQETNLGISAATLIPTMKGIIPATDLHAGDRVLTRDYGPRTVRSVGQSYRHSGMSGVKAPVHIKAGALGNGLPQNDICVAPRQKVLISSVRAELMFGCTEVLVHAEDLLGMPGVTEAKGDGTTYVHLVFDQLELFMSEGMWLESTVAPDATAAALHQPPAEGVRIGPYGFGPGGASSRMTLLSTEASALMHS